MTEFISTGVITVGGVQLETGDLTIVRYVELPPRTAEDAAAGVADYEPQTDSDVVILVDTLSRPELVRQGLARELVNRIQRLRKSAGLIQTDEVDVYFSDFTQGSEAVLVEIVEEHDEGIRKVLKSVPRSKVSMAEGQTVIKDEVNEVGDHIFSLSLCWPEGVSGEL